MRKNVAESEKPIRISGSARSPVALKIISAINGMHERQTDIAENTKLAVVVSNSRYVERYVGIQNDIEAAEISTRAATTI